MRSQRRALAAMAFVGATLGAAAAQGPQTPAEIASAIADTIRANTRTAPGSPITLSSATSHDNVVEIRYVVTDAAMFARFKGSAESSRLSLAAHFCTESRKEALIQGVVVHEVFAMSSPNDQVEFTIDKSSCDSLTRVAPADAKTLAELALAAAKAENATASSQSQSAYHLVEATAHQGVVDLRFVVRDASTAAAMQAEQRNLAGYVAGYLCGKYLDSIHRGLVFHSVFAVTNGPPTIEFTIDRSAC